MFALYAETAAARVELRAEGRRRIALLRKAGAGPVLVALGAIATAGPVTLRVLHGTVAVDAVADAPARR